MRRVKLVKLSACDCGFPLLKESIALGTEYLVDDRKPPREMTLICGGCHKHVKLIGIFVFAREPLGRSDYLPEAVFEDL